MQGKYLLIWEEMPENIFFVSLENLTPEEIATLEAANGAYINTTTIKKRQQQAALKISAAMDKCKYKPQEMIAWEIDPEWHPKAWHKKSVKAKNLPESGPYEKVFHSGIYL